MTHFFTLPDGKKGTAATLLTGGPPHGWLHHHNIMVASSPSTFRIPARISAIIVKIDHGCKPSWYIGVQALVQGLVKPHRLRQEDKGDASHSEIGVLGNLHFPIRAPGCACLTHC